MFAKRVRVVRSSNDEEGRRFVAAVRKVCLSNQGEQQRVALDCEGVDLSRFGSLELVTICFDFKDTNKELYLVDLGTKKGEPDKEVIKAVRELCENEHVIKIIHDCRMDSDALYHLHQISLKNVHDTSCFNEIITGGTISLNDVLKYMGLSVSNFRNKSVYERNPSFWSVRPLTEQMKQWASSDVDTLLDLASKQLLRLDNESKGRAMMESEKYIAAARDKKLRRGLSVRNPGRFIGRGGSNINRLQRVTNTLIYQDHSNKTWCVYYDNDASLEQVILAMDS